MYYSLEELDSMLNQGWSVYEYYYPLFVNGKTINKLGGKTKSPFLRDGRIEEDPSFSVFMHSRKGKVFFNDFGSGITGTHWKFVMELYGLDFKEAVKKVKLDILGIFENGKVMTKAKPAVFKRIETVTEKVYLTPAYRPWDDFDLSFFKGAGISKSTLEKFHTQAISHYDFTRGEKTYRIMQREESPMYCIDFPSGRRKIYQPLGDPKFKWTSNTIAEEDFFGADIAPQRCKHIFMLGGNRDTMSFFENIGFPCMALASESANFPIKLLNALKGKVENVWILYNNDKQGYRKAEKFEAELGFKPLNHIFKQFSGKNDDGTANDFVDMYQNNADAIPRFNFFLGNNIVNLYN